MLFLHKLGRLINALSIDVALGAWACSRLFFIDTGLTPNLYIDLALILSVWLIYTADHLYDAKREFFQELSYRHEFHKKHFKSILTIWLTVLISLVWLVIFMLPIETKIFGFGLAIFVGLHFLINHILKIRVIIGKESRIAIFYALGTSIPAMSLAESFTIQQVFILMHIALLAFENLLLFSIAEYGYDRLDDLPSISKKWQPEILQYFVKIALMIHLALIIGSYFFVQSVLILSIMACMLALMSTIFLTFEKHIKLDRYRVLADGLFLLPIIAILLR